MAVYCTSSAVNGLPSCQATPGRNWNVWVSPSGALVQEVASTGPGLPAPSRSTSASMILEVMM